MTEIQRQLGADFPVHFVDGWMQNGVTSRSDDGAVVRLFRDQPIIFRKNVVTC